MEIIKGKFLEVNNFIFTFSKAAFPFLAGFYIKML